MATTTPKITEPEIANSSSAEFDVEKNTNKTSTNEKPNGSFDGVDGGIPSDHESENFQEGVQRVRAVTTVWSKKTLWLMFALLYLVSFIDMLALSLQYALNPYITSQFGKHGLLASVSIVSTIVSGCSRLTLAKVVDIWGRVEGFIAMLFLMVIAAIMKATCKNIETYFAAHTMWWVGHIGLTYCIDVMMADMTTLRNRMIMFGVNGTPTIATTFAGPKIAQLYYDNLNFRWAFGSFAIILVGVCFPVIVIMLFEQRKAAKLGAIPVKGSGRNWFQSVCHYFIELDFIGIILATAVFALILLPFSIATYAPNKWATPYIIAMEVLGVLCIPAFCIWEIRFARVQFLPWKYLREPTLIGSCLLYAIMFTSIFCWNSYFSSYLQVVYRLSITTSGYVLNALSLSSAILSPIIGVVISYTGDFKWTAYAGIPFLLIGTAILIPLREPGSAVGLVVLTQILCGIGSGLFAACANLAVMASVSHQEVAVVLAIWGLFGSIGAAIGAAIAGALWNNILPSQLEHRLPEESKHLAKSIFASLVTQLSYEDGTPERDAIVGAYGDVQKKMVIAGSCFMPLILASIYIWRNINLKKLERERAQTRGNVF